MFLTGIECISFSIANSDSITAKKKFTSDKMISFNEDLSFGMMIILNFVVTKKYYRMPKGHTCFGKILVLVLKLCMSNRFECFYFY